jgi:hypothetical protein
MGIHGTTASVLWIFMQTNRGLWNARSCRGQHGTSVILGSYLDRADNAGVRRGEVFSGIQYSTSVGI